MGQRGRVAYVQRVWGGGGEWQKNTMYGSPGASFSAASPHFGLRTLISSSEGQWWPVGLVVRREGRRCGRGADVKCSMIQPVTDIGETEAVFARTSEGTLS